MSLFGGRGSRGINRHNYFESEEYKNERGEMKAWMRRFYNPTSHTGWRQPKAADVSYSKRSFWEAEEQPKKVRRPYVWDDSRFNARLEESKEKIMGIMQKLYDGTKVSEAPPAVTLSDDGIPTVQNQVDDEEQRENLFHVEEEVSLVPTQVCEDLVQLQEDVEMVESKEEKVEIEENELMQESLLDQSDDLELELVDKEEMFVEAKLCKGKVLPTNDLDHLSPSIFYVQDFEDIVPDYTLSSILSIQGNEHRIELEGVKDFEEFEEKKKLNFFPFDVGGEQDLRTNPLQEGGNDAARRSWNSIHGPRIEDEMG